MNNKKPDLASVQEAIEALSADDYAVPTQWWVDHDWQRWDRKIEDDSKSGKLDHLVKEARREKAQGLLKDL